MTKTSRLKKRPYPRQMIWLLFWAQNTLLRSKDLFNKIETIPGQKK